MLRSRFRGFSRLWRDAVHSARSLARTPALAITIVATVGVGLGATTGMISVVRAILVNPLPYATPDELFWIYTDSPPNRFRLSVVDYRALEADHPGFSAVAAYQTSTVTVSERDHAERVTAKSVTGSYFPLLGQSPQLGRLFTEADDASSDQVAVLTGGYWARRFGSDPGVLGRTLTIDGRAHLVVGVLKEVMGPLEKDVAIFTAARWPQPRRKGPFFTMVLGRLRPDVPRAAALDALRATNARLFPIWKSSYQDDKATWGMMELKTRVIGDVSATLLVVLAAVGCLLLIACANAMNLLVARALNRSRELAIRAALGASRGQLLQQLIVETVLLAAAATMVAVEVALLAIRLVAAYGATYIPRIDEVELSWPAIAWLAALSTLSAMLMLLGGAVPVLRRSPSEAGLDRVLRSGGRLGTDGRTAQRLRRGLVAAEFMLATPLLIAAVLITASLDRLSRVSVGIETERLLTAAVSLSGPRYSREEDRSAFWQRALERFASLPGVEAAAIADGRPPKELNVRNNFELEDHPTPPGQNQPLCPWVAVSPEFFKTVGLPLERGRLLDQYSLNDNVVVVDRAWANRFFPGQEVLGRRFRSGGCTTCPWTTVVGLVGNVKWGGLEASEEGTVYWPFVDFPNAFLILRTRLDPASPSLGLLPVLQELDPALPLSKVATGDELVSTSLAAPRYLSVLVGIFAVAALVLSVVGIYGVMAYFVQQHTRDIGIRLALGGEPSAVRRMIVGQGLRFVAIGVGLGAGFALLTARFLTTVLFEVSAMDLRTMTGVPLMLLGIAMLGCLVPGYRAAQLDPAEILREN